MRPVAITPPHDPGPRSVTWQTAPGARQSALGRADGGGHGALPSNTITAAETLLTTTRSTMPGLHDGDRKGKIAATRDECLGASGRVHANHPTGSPAAGRVGNEEVAPG